MESSTVDLTKGEYSLTELNDTLHACGSVDVTCEYESTSRNKQKISEEHSTILCNALCLTIKSLGYEFEEVCKNLILEQSVNFDSNCNSAAFQLKPLISQRVAQLIMNHGKDEQYPLYLDSLDKALDEGSNQKEQDTNTMIKAVSEKSPAPGLRTAFSRQALHLQIHRLVRNKRKIDWWQEDNWNIS